MFEIVNLSSFQLDSTNREIYSNWHRDQIYQLENCDTIICDEKLYLITYYIQALYLSEESIAQHNTKENIRPSNSRIAIAAVTPITIFFWLFNASINLSMQPWKKKNLWDSIGVMLSRWLTYKRVQPVVQWITIIYFIELKKYAMWQK